MGCQGPEQALDAMGGARSQAEGYLGLLPLPECSFPVWVPELPPPQKFPSTLSAQVDAQLAGRIRQSAERGTKVETVGGGGAHGALGLPSMPSANSLHKRPYSHALHTCPPLPDGAQTRGCPLCKGRGNGSEIAQYLAVWRVPAPGGSQAGVLEAVLHPLHSLSIPMPSLFPGPPGDSLR